MDALEVAKNLQVDPERGSHSNKLREGERSLVIIPLEMEARGFLWRKLF